MMPLYDLEARQRIPITPHEGKELPTPEDTYGGPNDRWMNPLSDPEMAEKAARVCELENAAYASQPYTTAHMKHHCHAYLGAAAQEAAR